MAIQETAETKQFTYEAFAAHPFYTEINRSLVQQALAHLQDKRSNAQMTIVDMACGTGAVTRLIAEELAHQGRTAHLIGVDPEAEALVHARENMKTLGIEAEFIQGESEDLPRLVSNADAAFFCNAIHLVPDKLVAFQQVARILAPGGIFACNSAFYEGTYVEGTERFYHSWMRHAMRWLRKEHPEVRLSRDAKAMAMQWLTPEGYMERLKQSGFGSVETSYTDAIISLDAWKDLGQYWLFVEGALPGAPVALGASALKASVYQTGHELGLSAVPRTWLQIVATKQ
ncbi:MAG: class I SAM-dependent methyltransferase [Chloroflexota bacterium]|nr:class I SAM-dependent methyltransferase [Chloroflexota bacterium]